MINRCRSGHYNLNSSLYHVQIVDNADCTCGFESQDLNHILWQCPLLDNNRLKLFENLAKYKMYPPLSVKEIRIEPNVKILKYVLEFLKKCNLTV